MKCKTTPVQRLLGLLGLALLLGMFVYLSLCWRTMPQKIPTHYNLAGEADKWGSRESLLALPILGTVVYAVLTLVGFVPAIWSLPGTVTTENQEQLYQGVRSMLLTFKALLMAVFFSITYFSSRAQTLPKSFLPIFLLLLFGAIAVSVWRTCKLMEKP